MLWIKKYLISRLLTNFLINAIYKDWSLDNYIFKTFHYKKGGRDEDTGLRETFEKG